MSSSLPFKSQAGLLPPAPPPPIVDRLNVLFSLLRVPRVVFSLVRPVLFLFKAEAVVARRSAPGRTVPVVLPAIPGRLLEGPVKVVLPVFVYYYCIFVQTLNK